MVVVLTRVHELWLGPVCRIERMVQWRDFHKVRASGGDQVDLDHFYFRYLNERRSIAIFVCSARVNQFTLERESWITPLQPV